MLLIALLREAGAGGGGDGGAGGGAGGGGDVVVASREKAARAISRLSRAHSSNQDALARSGGIDLGVSLLAPRAWSEHKNAVGVPKSRSLQASSKDGKEGEEAKRAAEEAAEAAAAAAAAVEREHLEHVRAFEELRCPSMPISLL